MFCAACGTPLVEFARFCHQCGIPVAPLPGMRGPADGILPPIPVQPRVQACIQCGGAGKVHRSSMPHHNASCIFCTVCPGCDGSGAIPGDACVCPKCGGAGKYHGSSMPHNDAGCIFCTNCETCQTRGWI